MLCEIANAWSFPLWGNFAATWAVLTLLGGVSIFLMSGMVFWRYYWRPTFERWQWKLNAEFPTPGKVRLEIRQMFKSLAAATLVPTLTLWLAAQNKGQAYCGVGEGHFGLSAHAYLVAQFAVFWIVSDFYEWGYHQIGHRFSFFWSVHKRAWAARVRTARPRYLCALL
jgi:sterol desaturase/sphingolipid hydroxylase (fatty acid hydroxylase superfamily)